MKFLKYLFTYKPSVKYISDYVKMKNGKMIPNSMLSDFARLNRTYKDELDFLEEYTKREKNNSASFLFGIIRNSELLVQEIGNTQKQDDMKEFTKISA